MDTYLLYLMEVTEGDNCLNFVILLHTCLSWNGIDMGWLCVFTCPTNLTI